MDGELPSGRLTERKVVLFIAASLDGYIAKKDGNIEFLAAVETPGEDYGYSDFARNADNVILGRKTYDKIKTLGIRFPHQNKKVFVLSKSKSGKNEDVTFFNDVKELIPGLKTEKGGDIFCDGGSELVYELLKHNFLDRIIISVIPCLLGDGIRLFKEGVPENKIILKKCISYPSGLVQLWYDIK